LLWSDIEDNDDLDSCDASTSDTRNDGVRIALFPSLRFGSLQYDEAPAIAVGLHIGFGYVDNAEPAEQG
jgi:hypothetical protein